MRENDKSPCDTWAEVIWRIIYRRRAVFWGLNVVPDADMITSLITSTDWLVRYLNLTSMSVHYLGLKKICRDDEVSSSTTNSTPCFLNYEHHVLYKKKILFSQGYALQHFIQNAWLMNLKFWKRNHMNHMQFGNSEMSPRYTWLNFYTMIFEHCLDSLHSPAVVFTTH